MQNLMGDDGLYHDSDGALDYTGNWVMLHALSDIADLTGDQDSRYMNPDAHQMFESAATLQPRMITMLRMSLTPCSRLCLPTSTPLTAFSCRRLFILRTTLPGS